MAQISVVHDFTKKDISVSFIGKNTMKSCQCYYDCEQSNLLPKLVIDVVEYFLAKQFVSNANIIDLPWVDESVLVVLNAWFIVDKRQFEQLYVYSFWFPVVNSQIINCKADIANVNI